MTCRSTDTPTQPMVVCCLVAPDLLPEVEVVAKALEALHPKSTGDQRVEMIFAAGVRALGRDLVGNDRIQGREASAAMTGYAARDYGERTCE